MDIHKMNTAIISDCGKYRYYLERNVSSKNNDKLLFIMLNPSTANAEINDNTIRRCLRIADNLNFGKLSVINLFSYRTTKPDNLRAVGDLYGEKYSEYTTQAIQDADKIIVAWGKFGLYRDRDKDFMLTYLKDKEVFALKLNKNGTPIHPLFSPSNSELIPFKPFYMNRLPLNGIRI